MTDQENPDCLVCNDTGICQCGMCIRGKTCTYCRCPAGVLAYRHDRSTPENTATPGPGLYIPHNFEGDLGVGRPCTICRNTADHVVHLPKLENTATLTNPTTTKEEDHD